MQNLKCFTSKINSVIKLTSLLIFFKKIMTLFLRYFFRFFIKLNSFSTIILVIGIFFQLYDYNCLGNMICILGLSLLMICSYLPTGRFLLYYLEHYFPQIDSLPNDVKGLILLGGFFSLLEKESKGRPIYNQAAGRIIEFISLAKKYSHLPIVFTGSKTEVALSQKLFQEMEIDMARATFEKDSVNTYDNSRNTFNLIKPNHKEKWVLVTSASHLPRSVGLFEQVGWNIVPYPVDYHTKSLNWREHFATIGHERNTVFWKLGIIEIAGLITNSFLGHSSCFLPFKNKTL